MLNIVVFDSLLFVISILVAFIICRFIERICFRHNQFASGQGFLGAVLGLAVIVYILFSYLIAGSLDGRSLGHFIFLAPIYLLGIPILICSLFVGIKNLLRGGNRIFSWISIIACVLGLWGATNFWFRF